MKTIKKYNNIELTNNAKNYGIDLLRIVAMLFIVILHSLGHGGVLSSLNQSTFNYKLAYFLEIFAYCAVDIFGIISGYVAYNSKKDKIKFSNLLNIWFETVFYCLLISIVFKFIIPNNDINIMKALLPISSNTYWYITAYFGLFIISPFLINSIKKYSNNYAKKLFVIIYLFFSIIGTIFNLVSGYTILWLVILFIIGMIINKCNLFKNIKIWKMIIIILGLVMITWIYYFYGFDISIFGKSIGRNILVSYTSPTILLIAMLYVVIFSKLKFTNTCKRIISFFSVSSLSIYLVNDHPLVRNYFIKKVFINFNLNLVILYVIVFSILFVIFMLFFDKIRQFIFKKIKINVFSKKIIDFISNQMNKLVIKL